MSPSTDTRENREFAAEVKFLISRPLAEQIREWARARLSPDPNAAGAMQDTYRISSLYFDTEKFDVFRRTGSFGRSKYRIRRYGASDTIFLERKLKTRGMVSKRRTLVPMEDLSRLADQEPERGWLGFWYHRRLSAREVRPVCQIAYERTARVLMTQHGPIRLTLDENIRTVATERLKFQDASEGMLLAPNHVILELKFRQGLPSLFEVLTNEFSLVAQPVSKYRHAVAALGLMDGQEAPVDGEACPTICLSS